MKLSRIDRIQKVLTVATLFPQLDPATVTSVSVGLLAPRNTPVAATIWTPFAVTAGSATVMFVGPDADSTGGAVAVAATADLWAKASGSFGEVEAVFVERITVLGAGQLAGPVIATSQSLIGLDTDGVPFYDPAGIGTPALISLDTDSVLYYTAP